jgi:hypothetical protein
MNADKINSGTCDCWILAAQAAAEQAREMLHAGVTGDEILTMLVNAAEDVAGGSAVCSILVLDKEGLLRNAASPNLPADYLAAIDRLKPNPGVGTCSAAAATGSVVVTAISKRMISGLNFAICPCRLGLMARGACRSKLRMAQCSGHSAPTFGNAVLRRRENSRA